MRRISTHNVAIRRVRLVYTTTVSKVWTTCGRSKGEDRDSEDTSDHELDVPEGEGVHDMEDVMRAQPPAFSELSERS